MGTMWVISEARINIKTSKHRMIISRQPQNDETPIIDGVCMTKSVGPVNASTDGCRNACPLHILCSPSPPLLFYNMTIRKLTDRRGMRGRGTVCLS